jgi:hypothetical protein
MWSPALSTLFLLLATSFVTARNEFLPPWTAGERKDYSDNFAYSIGTTVRFSWVLNFERPTLQLWQDNRPGDAQGGPSVVIKGTSLLTPS